MNDINMSSKTYAIQEMAILQEAKEVQTLPGNKVRFKALLQMMEEYSYNGKKYLRSALIPAIEEKRQMMEQNAFVGEMDHPMDPTPNRLLNILYKNVSHLFKEVYTEGNQVWGIVENTSNDVGRNLYAFIVQDKIPVGFSMRAMGDVRNTNEGQEVYKNIDLVTWDCVSTPAFSNCILSEILTSRKHMESKALKEEVANLEEYIYGESPLRHEMLQEGKMSEELAKVISIQENRYLFINQDFKFKYFRDMLKREVLSKMRA
jgi:hypothetical protein